MELRRQAIDRVIQWRVHGYWTRMGQALVVVPLAWLATRSWLVLAWFALTTLTSTIDALAFRRVAAHADLRGRVWPALVAMGFSNLAFSSIGPILLAHLSTVSLAGTAVLLCAINLNNAVMTRGWRPAAILSVTPSSLMMTLATPLAALAFHYDISLVEGLVLEAGAIAYVVFIALLAATLDREGGALRLALADQERQRDLLRQAMSEAEDARAHWSMLFDLSPLPQVCFDASQLYLRIRSDGAGGRLDLSVRDLEQAFDLLALTAANRAIEDLIGVARLEGDMDVRHFHPSFLTGFVDSLNRASADGVFPHFDSQMTRADGAVIDVRVHIRTLPTDATPWRTCIASFSDITDARRIARAQQEAVEAAESANRAKSEFLAIMSHEIRTPLNGVLGMVQVMERDPLDPIQLERLEVIRQSGGELLSILNDILDLSKIEAGRLELEAAPFALASLAKAAVTAFEPLAAAKGLSLTLSLGEGADGLYRGDAGRVRQILNNLISNAVKFTAQGSVDVAICGDARGFRLIVTDTGVGVAPDRLERLFDKFVQADSSTTRRFGGTGLGLAICRELCRSMGGEVTVESVQGEGSRFAVQLPLVRLAEAAAAQEAGLALEGADLPAPRRLRILAAEDNAVNQLVLSTLLSQAGLAPVMVGDGRQALDAWERDDWDLILMDVQMPVMDGPSATRQIRRREAETGRPMTPIIALTANAMTHQAETYRAAGMNGFVAKPIELPRLFEAIAAALGETERPFDWV